MHRHHRRRLQCAAAAARRDREGGMNALVLALAFALVVPAQSVPANLDNIEIQTIPVQGNVYMLAGAGGNITLQAGADGVLLVDTQYERLASKIVAAIRRLSDKPIYWIIDTSIDPDHTGGNEALPRLANAATRQGVRIIAHENVVKRMSAEPRDKEPAVPDALWPNDEYFTPQKDFSFNGEAVVIYHMPAAHTDGDSIVFFRSSNVVSVGDIFTPGRYPVIDLQKGGTVQGLINALNRILQITVPLKYQEAGTYVIPGHGRICDEADVVEYRDMVTIIRDRVQDLIKKGMTLEQVKAARPTRDYDTEYGGPDDAFLEAVYKSLSGQK
jgi:glyoxylase-like metal-dependent hydrolase (beta-lactamase superfamily II)